MEFTNLKINLYKNKYKKSDNHPDMTGNLFNKETKEKVMKVAGWISSTKDGEKYISLSFSEIKKYNDEQNKNNRFDDLDDGSDLPF